MSTPSTDSLLQIYEETSTIAVVGLSSNEHKPANIVPRYLQEQGYRIIPVNPREESLLGERSYPSLSDVQEPVDLVLVFRPAEEAPALAEAAVELGARTLWLQDGIVSEAARAIAEDAGVTVLMDMCMGRTHGTLGLGPGA
jgi:predicted CoA-binding protein